MSYVQVDSSVRTNRKFLQAGEAASWLWLCGTAYCQDTLTDGFIPYEAVRFLGVANPKPLIPKLVKAKLWDECEGGWRIHDYLEHNKSADDIKQLRRRRGDGGKLGGRPQQEPSSQTLKVSHDGLTHDKPSDTPEVKHPQNPPPTSTSATTSTSTNKEHTRSALESAFDRFWAVYPRKVGKDAAWKAFKKIHPDDSQVDQWIAAVSRQAKGWKDPEFIPHPSTWINAGRWKDEEVPSSPSAVLRLEWHCPHVEACSHREMCRIATELGRPEKQKESA